MFARIIYGGRISIAIGVVGTLTAALVGILVGAISGYVGGWLDNFLMRFVDIMYGLPYMLIVIIIMAMIGEKARGSFVVLFVAIALVSWLTIARVVRGQIISLKIRNLSKQHGLWVQVLNALSSGIFCQTL